MFATSGMPGIALRTAAAQHQHRVGVDVEVGVVDAGVHVLDGVEHHRRPAVREQVRRRRGRLDHRADPGRGCRAAPRCRRRSAAAGRAAGSPPGPRSAHRRGRTTSGRPVTVSASGSSRSRTSRSTASSPPARWKSSIRNRPAGCRSTSSGTPAPIRSKSSRVSSMPEPAGDRQQVDDGVGGPADRGQRDDRVEERAPGQDRARPPSVRDELDDQPAGLVRRPRAAGCPGPGCRPGPGGRCPAPRRPAPSSTRCPSCCSDPCCGSSRTRSGGTASFDSVSAADLLRQLPHVGAAAERHAAEGAGEHRPARDRRPPAGPPRRQP